MTGFGTRIRALRARQGISQNQLAEALGVSRSAVAMWESDAREPSLEMLLHMAEALGAAPAELLSAATDAPFIAPVQTRRIPLIPTAEPMQPLETAPLIDAAETDCDIALRVTDDSMSPTLQPGDLVFLRRGEPDSDGRIVALLHEGRVLLKRLYRYSGQCTLLSDNPTHPPMLLPQPEIIGAAVSYRRALQ